MRSPSAAIRSRFGVRMERPVAAEIAVPEVVGVDDHEVRPACSTLRAGRDEAGGKRAQRSEKPHHAASEHAFWAERAHRIAPSNERAATKNLASSRLRGKGWAQPTTKTRRIT